MNIQDELHRRVDALDLSDLKQRLHLLIAEMDEETLRKILMHGAKVSRRQLEKLGFAI